MCTRRGERILLRAMAEDVLHKWMEKLAVVGKVVETEFGLRAVSTGELSNGLFRVDLII